MTPEISERQRTVAAMKVDAVELTARAKDEWIKGEVRKAVRDLDEALSWMRPKDVGASTVLLIADVAISAAAGRLTAIKEVLGRYDDQAEVAKPLSLHATFDGHLIIRASPMRPSVAPEVAGYERADAVAAVHSGRFPRARAAAGGGGTRRPALRFVHDAVDAHADTNGGSGTSPRHFPRPLPTSRHARPGAILIFRASSPTRTNT